MLETLERIQEEIKCKVDDAYTEKIKVETLLELLETKTVELNSKKELAELLEKVNTVLTNFFDLKRQGVIEKVENLVSYGLKAVFNQEYKFKVVIKPTANNVYTELKLEAIIDGKAVETDIMDSHGGGFIDVIAFILRLVVMHYVGKDRRELLVLDEAFSHVSREYLDNLAEFIKELSEKLHVQMIIVTHKPELIECGDYVYDTKLVNGRTVFERLKGV